MSGRHRVSFLGHHAELAWVCMHDNGINESNSCFLRLTIHMNGAAIGLKLAQLRLKTDQELSLMIDNSLESALNLLDSEKPKRDRAEQAYAEAVKLLSKVDDLDERRRLKNKLMQVREALKRLSTADELRVQVACS
jgi:hypothetical protein